MEGDTEVEAQAGAWYKDLDAIHILHAWLVPNLQKLCVILEADDHLDDVNSTLQALVHRNLDVELIDMRNVNELDSSDG